MEQKARRVKKKGKVAKDSGEERQTEQEKGNKRERRIGMNNSVPNKIERKIMQIMHMTTNENR